MMVQTHLFPVDRHDRFRKGQLEEETLWRLRSDPFIQSNFPSPDAENRKRMELSIKVIDSNSKIYGPYMGHIKPEDTLGLSRIAPAQPISNIKRRRNCTQNEA